MAADHDVRSHTDRLFVDQVLRSRAGGDARRARRLRLRVGAAQLFTESQIRSEYRMLSAIFRARVVSFERKRYVNLSHAQNKAMNLNTYIGLLGGRFQERTDAQGTHLERVDTATDADLVDAPSDYLLTLDADSILLPGYALRLVREMERPGNERVAVTQTPQRLPSTPSRVEQRTEPRTTSSTSSIKASPCMGPRTGSAPTRSFVTPPSATSQRSAANEGSRSRASSKTTP